MLLVCCIARSWADVLQSVDEYCGFSILVEHLKSNKKKKTNRHLKYGAVAALTTANRLFDRNGIAHIANQHLCYFRRRKCVIADKCLLNLMCILKVLSIEMLRDEFWFLAVICVLQIILGYHSLWCKIRIEWVTIAQFQ